MLTVSADLAPNVSTDTPHWHEVLTATHLEQISQKRVNDPSLWAYGQPVQGSGSILATWQEELPTDCPNRSFLLQGVADGFNIVDIDKISTPVETDNYYSATSATANKVEKQIITELENGHYKIVDQKPIIVSALGAIPKKDSNKVR